VGASLLIRYFGRDPDEETLPDPAAAVWQRHALSTLLATVPDPAASHMDWAFDYHVDSIRRAHERMGYVLFGYEYPWKLEVSNRLAGRPGAMLFRRVEQGWTELALVYLVGEVTSLGVDRAGLQEALREREILRRGAPCFREPFTLRLLGPTFSGSCPSLKAGMLEHGFEPGTVIEVISGAATSESNKVRLEHGSAELAIRYSTTLHTDETLLGALRSRVLKRLGLVEKEVAVLQESSTEYGQKGFEAAPDESGFLRVPFPMSLQSLRTAYGNKGVTGGDGRLPGRAKMSRIELDLLDAPRPLETPALTSTLSPDSIELLFDEVARALGQRRIRLVLLFATDVRDKLFLARELKRRLPDLQLATTESNVLYLEPELNRYLRGMIVLSTYPLLLRDPRWTPQSGFSEQLMFASEGAEGTFNATLVHIAERMGEETWRWLADYSIPVRAAAPEASGAAPQASVPPVWGTVVGAGAMLPLFVLDKEAISMARALEAPPPDGVPRAEKSPCTRAGEQRTVSVFLSLSTLMVLALLLCLVQVVPGYRTRWPSAFVLLHEGYSLGISLVGLAAILPALTVMAFSLLPWSGSAAAGLALVSLVSLVPLVPWVWRSRRTWGAHSSGRSELACQSSSELLALAFFLAMVVALLFAMIAFAGRLGSLARSGGGALFLHRAAEVEQGVTPLVPVFLVGLLVALWLQWLRNRVRCLADAEAFEETLSLLAPQSVRLQEVVGPLRERLRELFPRPLLCSFLLVLGVLGWWRLESSLERLVDPWLARLFEGVLGVAVLGGMLGACWAGLRLVRLWDAFKKLLHRLEDLVITLSFEELRKVLRVTANLSLWPSWHGTELHSLARVKWGELRRVLRPGALPPEVGEHRRKDMQVVAQALAALVRAVRGRAEGFGCDEESKVPEALCLARQVIALELLMYVEWVLRYFRHLCRFLVLGGLLGLALVGSYPFQPQNEFQWLALALFGLSLAVVVYLILALNRNATLSRLAGTEPGSISLDRALLSNVALFVVVPLTAVIGAKGGVIQDLLGKILPLLVTGF
jgi:hypothetical protein